MGIEDSPVHIEDFGIYEELEADLIIQVFNHVSPNCLMYLEDSKFDETDGFSIWLSKTSKEYFTTEELKRYTKIRNFIAYDECSSKW